MEQIDTVSKGVDEAKRENIMGHNENGTYLSKSTVSSYPTDGRSQTGTSNGSKELPLAVVREPPQETQAIYYDNPVFDIKETKVGHERMSFADVVTEVMQEPIKEDIHPFGRGSLYRFPLGGEQTQMQREEGTLFMWVVVTVMILGVAVGVIVLSQMYQAHHNENTSNESSHDMNATEY